MERVKDYADAKFGCVPVECHLLCHYRPRELAGRGTKGPGIPRTSHIHPLPYGGKFWVAQPRHLGFFGLRNSRHRWMEQVGKICLFLKILFFRPSVVSLRQVHDGNTLDKPFYLLKHYDRGNQCCIKIIEFLNSMELFVSLLVSALTAVQFDLWQWPGLYCRSKSLVKGQCEKPWS